MKQERALKLVSEAMAIEAESAKDADAIGFMARMLVQSTLPHSKTKELIHQRSNGTVTISVTANPKIGLPFGTYPRLLLSWITTEALRTKSPTLELGHSLSSFMEDLGLQVTGGRRGTISRLRQHMDRLFYSVIDWQYRGDGHQLDLRATPFEARELWWDPRKPNQGSLFQSSLTLHRRFFEEIVSRPVPLDMRALKILAREQSPLALDIYSWLTYRMSYLREETTIPWEALQLQFGGDYKLVRQFRAKFISRLKLVKTLYPAAKVVPQQDGLTLHPSPPHVPKKLFSVT